MFTIQGSAMVPKEIRLSANSISKMSSGAHSAGEGIPGSLRSDPGVRRRQFLITTAMTLVFSATSARALVVKGSLPWVPNAGTPPTAVHPGPWVYFTPEEGAAIEALVDRLIPPDPQTPGGKDAGCAVFIDRQLAGSYGSAEGLYMHGPFANGTPEQGNQSPLTPAARYRQALAALDKYCRAGHAGRPFAQIPDDEKDKVAHYNLDKAAQYDSYSCRPFGGWRARNQDANR